MARKGTVLTEAQITWGEISAEAWTAAGSAAAARAANGNPMSDEEIERRARNAQDREDIRRAAWGGNLGANCKNMSRTELIEEINRQLQTGIHGTSKQAFKKVRETREAQEKAPRKMAAKFAGTCKECGGEIKVGQTMYWNPEWRIASCEACH